MAKTESTAVNALIDQVQAGRSMSSEPAGDLFSAPVSTKIQPPRMTSTVPPMRGAGEVAPLPRARAPQSTSTHALPAIPAPPQMRMTTAQPARGTTIPPLARPASARSAPAGTLPPPGRTAPPPTIPVAAPFEAGHVSKPDVSPLAAAAATGTQPVSPAAYPIVQPPNAPHDHWYEPSAPVPRVESNWFGSHVARHQHRNETFALVKRLTLPTLALAALMVAGYFAFLAPDRTKRAAVPNEASAAPPPAAAAVAADEHETVVRGTPSHLESANAATASAAGTVPEPPTREEQAAEIAAATMTQDAPAAAVDGLARRASENGAGSAVREIVTPSGVVRLVDVRIDSDPPGATVTLVDRGKQSFLGTTPLSTSLDPSREYDVIVALDGRPTQMVHLDATKTTRVDVTLGRASRGKDRAREETRRSDADGAREQRRSSRTRVERAVAPAVAPEAPRADEIEAPRGMGTLMVSSKPPCEIYIDGKPTGLTTPQRSIELPAGTHAVTLVNDLAGIKKTVSVKITADQPTKLIQDLMAK